MRIWWLREPTTSGEREISPEAGADGERRIEENFWRRPAMLLTVFRSLSFTAFGSRGFSFGGYSEYWI